MTFYEFLLYDLLKNLRKIVSGGIEYNQSGAGSG
jgi:hypothetical protein